MDFSEENFYNYVCVITEQCMSVVWAKHATGMQQVKIMMNCLNDFGKKFK